QYVEQLQAAKGRVRGERRVVTILFSDVKGSTAMAENLDPEEVMEIMDGAFEVLIEPIYRYEGTLARLMGDAILAFFGAPIAHEDDPERAGRAALDILAGARRYAARLERERGITGFNVRVGINTGLVVVGEVGTDLRVEYTAMGDAVNLAARMESAAEPGTVLITQDTHRLIRPWFETETLDPIQVKGKADPVRVFRLLGLKAAPGVGRGIEGLHSPLIGRDAELQKLQTAIRALQEGEGSRVAVIGEAGLGKSRLVAEARQSLAPGATWVEGRCLSYTADMSYWMARDVLYGLLGVSADTPPAEVGTTLHSSLARLAGAGLPTVPPLARSETGQSGKASPNHATRDSQFAIHNSQFTIEIYPFLARLLDVPLEDELEERLERLGAEALHGRILQAFSSYVTARSLEQPLVLVWEDLHWIDPSSLKLLETLWPLTDQVPLLLLLAFRPNEGPVWDFHRRMQTDDSAGYQVIELAPLTRDDSSRLVRGLLRIENLPAETRRVILDKAEGNPFFLEELLRSLIDAGLVILQGDQAVATRAVEEIHVPDTLQGVIAARIDRLPPQDKRTLQTASVIGRVFQYGVLARLLDPATANGRLNRSVDELRRREFIRLVKQKTSEVSEDFGSLEQEYAFQHAMTQEVTYNGLLIAQRRDLHRRAGEAIEALFPDRLAEQSATLAYHFEKASVHDKAFTYLVQTAGRAARVYANQEAIGYYQRALALAQKAGVQPADLTTVHEGLGDVYYVVSEYQPAMEQYDMALEHVEDPHHLVALHRKRGQVCEKWGRYDEAKACFEAGLTQLGALQDTTELARIYTGLGLVYYHQGDLDAAVELGALALDMVERSGDDWGIAQACSNLGVVYSRRGDWEQAGELHRRCLSIWEDVGEPYGLATAHNNLGLVYRNQDEWGPAVEHYQQSLELFEKLGNRHGVARAYDNLSQVYMDQGEQEQAMEYLTRAVTILADIGVEESEILPEMWRSGAW
ncbi:MAG: tetratricopeptide repeat protein, partial [Anaerolineae bacterium]